MEYYSTTTTTTTTTFRTEDGVEENYNVPDGGLGGGA